jgi:protein involved in temperature-dependent protein secretion
MTFQEGDWIRADDGRVGKVLYVFFVSAYLSIDFGAGTNIQHLHTNQVTKIPPPPEGA